MSDSTEPGREAHSLGGAIHRLHDKWGAIVAFGALLIALGAIAVIFAWPATNATVIVNGVVFLIGGAAEIGIGAHAQAWSKFFLWMIGGVLYLFVGLVCIFDSGFASVVLTLVLGAGLIAAGVVRLYLALAASRRAAAPAGVRGRRGHHSAGADHRHPLAGRFHLGAGNPSRR